ncbi:hypothetical protein HNR00_001666 [Methylorubrum rhodinum]|jgi:hypothetical protein|uniref:Nitrate reductase n=1 Tax=Methylorubrum rhodinum TaxID=29428 RepID=A0A840ZIJ5_9HYPH|nr:hypothetical protein [Methylorubrum rhodinum]MBB5756958.1 hypothetical protein [Methylorubrum rhodinum]
MALFGRRERPDAPARRRVEAWARAAGGYGPDTAMTVSEIVCADPACPGFETVILILAPNRPTRAVKVAGAVDALDEARVAAAVVSAGA